MQNPSAWSKFVILHKNSTNGQFSLLGFTTGVSFFFFFLLFNDFAILSLPVILSIYISLVGLILYLIFYFFAPDQWPNVVRAFGLGCAFGLGITFCVVSRTLEFPRILWPFGLYLMVLSFFHWSEYYITALYNHPRCCISVYMLTHSTEYLTALGFCITEYWLENFIFHYLLGSAYFMPVAIHLFGLITCITSEALRKVSMATAAGNFNHFVEHYQRDDHMLVTTGVYGYFRHPAYAGWYYWSLFTQVLLGNPFSLIGFAFASYYFFSERIEFEERALISFFGDDYRQYQENVSTGIPFVKGYRDARFHRRSAAG